MEAKINYQIHKVSDGKAPDAWHLVRNAMVTQAGACCGFLPSVVVAVIQDEQEASIFDQWLEELKGKAKDWKG